MSVKLLTEHHLRLLSLKRGCTGLYESTLVKMPHCWKSHVTAHMFKNPFCLFSARRVPPHFTIPPKDIEVEPGSEANITCVAVGSPMPQVVWREGARDLRNKSAEIPIGRNMLMLKNVRESKNYTCVASSDLGNIESEVQVRVKGRRMICIVFA